VGIFKKDNLFLPVAKNRLYPEYFLPDSYKIPIINFEWYEICLRNRNATGKEIWDPSQPVNAISLVIEFPNVNQNIESRIKGLAEIILEKIALPKEENLAKEIESRLFVGGGLAYVEHYSGLMIKGLIHPSVANAISIIKTKVEKDDFYIGHALDKAVEVGYGVTRFSKDPIELFVQNLKRIE